MVLQPKHSNKINRNLVPTTSTQVVVNDVKIEIALWGCRLQGKVPYSTIYSRVKAAREKGTYNEEIRRAEEKKIGAVIEIIDNDSASSGNILPVTMTTATTTSSSSSGKAGNSTTITSLSSKLRKRPRQSSKQASVARLNAKRAKLDYDTRYKAAFKDATNLVAAAAANNTTAREPVQKIATNSIESSCLTGRSA